MRRVTILAATVAAIAFPAAATASQPRVHVVGLAPLAITGSGFVPHERVALRLGASVVGRVRAAATGSFRLTVPAIRLDRCGGGLVVTALAASGTVATTKIPRPACMPMRGGNSDG